LAGSSTPPTFDEDSPTIKVVATLAAGENGGTCKTRSKRDIPITTDTTLTPWRSGDTSARWGCGGWPVDDPVSI
jgi:hypothetical protein